MKAISSCFSGKFKNFVENHDKKIAVGLGSLIGVASIYEVSKDYKKSDEKDKNKVIVRDITIFAGCGVGAVSGNNLSKYILKNNNQIKSKLLKIKIPFLNKLTDQFIDKNKVDKTLDYFIEDIGAPIGSIAGGLATSFATDKLLPINSLKSPEKIERKLKILQEFDYKNTIRLYGYEGLGLSLDTGLATLSGFNAAKEESPKNRVLRSFYSIISIIPMILMTGGAFSVLNLNEKKPFVKLPIVVGIATLGCYIGNSIANWFNKKVTKEMLRKEVWKEASKRQRAMMKYTVDNFQYLDGGARSRIMTGMQKLGKVKQSVKPKEDSNKS